MEAIQGKKIEKENLHDGEPEPGPLEDPSIQKKKVDDRREGEIPNENNQSAQSQKNSYEGWFLVGQVLIEILFYFLQIVFGTLMMYFLLQWMDSVVFGSEKMEAHDQKFRKMCFALLTGFFFTSFVLICSSNS